MESNRLKSKKEMLEMNPSEWVRYMSRKTNMMTVYVKRGVRLARALETMCYNDQKYYKKILMADVLKHQATEIKKLRNVGAKTWSFVCDLLDESGLNWGMTDEDIEDAMHEQAEQDKENNIERVVDNVFFKQIVTVIISNCNLGYTTGIDIVDFAEVVYCETEDRINKLKYGNNEVNEQAGV